MTALIAERELLSGTRARVLVIRASNLQVDPDFRETPMSVETVTARILGEARLAQPLTPVPSNSNLLHRPQTMTHPTLGEIDVFSERAKVSLSASTALMSPLFLLRSRTTDLDQKTLLTNSGYFLFLEPDLDEPWNAYGDPVGLVMCNGRLDFSPQLPRAALMVSQDRSCIERVGFADVKIALPNGQQVRPHPFGNPKLTHEYVAFARFHGAENRCTPAAGDCYELVYIGRYAMAGRTGGGMPIPRAGCVVRFPSREIALKNASQPLHYSLESDWQDGIQTGPQILRDGEITASESNIFLTEYLIEAESLPDLDTVSPAGWKADWDKTRAARLGAGVDQHGCVMLVGVEGTSSMVDLKGPTHGATLRDLAQLLKEEGAIAGLNLDGGGSTQVFGQAGGALIQPMDVHHRLPDRIAQYDRPIPIWIRAKIAE